jgi:hypothetical protein
MPDNLEMPGIMLSLNASIQANTGELARSRKRQEALQNNLWILDMGNIPMPNPTLDIPNLLGPVTGQAWSIGRISIFGFTAGSVSVFIDSVNGNQVDLLSAAGSLKYGKGQLALTAGHRLVFSSTGLTGTPIINVFGVQMAESLLPEYLI